MNHSHPFCPLNPAELLKQLAGTHKSCCLKIASGLTTWKIFLENRQLIYIAYTVEGAPQLPLQRVRQHLTRLGHAAAATALEESFTATPRLGFAQSPAPAERPYYRDHAALAWLLLYGPLTSSQVAVLAETLFDEALTQLLWVTEGHYEITDAQFRHIPGLHPPDLPVKVETCQRKLRAWEKLSPIVTSIYQRLYLVDPEAFCSTNTQSATQLNFKKKLLPLLKKGYSFWKLASLLCCDELLLARFLYPHITANSIQLKEPSRPFNKLPKHYPAWPTVRHPKPIAARSDVRHSRAGSR